MTRDEFGADLFEAIKCIGGIVQLRELRAHTQPHVLKPGQLTDWGTREKGLLKELDHYIAHLPAQDLNDLVAHYPWVGQC